MRPANYILANFANRRSCLCTQQQNLSLKLKMVKRHSKEVPSIPDVFIKNCNCQQDIDTIFKNCNVIYYSYEEWKKALVVVKLKSREEKTVEKKAKTILNNSFAIRLLRFEAIRTELSNKPLLKRL